MGKYFVKRLLHGLFAIVVVVAIVMVMIYSLLDRQHVFATDEVYSKRANNDRTTYKYMKWEEYGYLDYVPYADWLNDLVREGEITAEERDDVASIGRTAKKDSDAVKPYVKRFTDYYQGKGYTVVRADAVMAGKKQVNGGKQILFAYRDKPLWTRLVTYFTSIFDFDNIHKVDELEDIGERKLTFTLFDPVYGGKKLSPAIIGNGTEHKYLLYFDKTFPFIHQNFLTFRLGKSYSINRGVDVFETMTVTQGSYVKSPVTYPTGLTESSADNLHSAVYSQGSLAASDMLSARFDDDYTRVVVNKNGLSKVGYSFSIGIIATTLAYLLGLPLGVLMSRKKDTVIDNLGTIYIIFITAVPSLAYIFLFKAVGGSLFGLPTAFNVDKMSWMMYVLPVVSLALPSVANLMKWMRRYMIDQMNSDYVKFARSEGLTEGEIFSKHIMKNAVIPIVHGIPGSVMGAVVGSIITERVYTVPGAGGMLTQAINAYDNGVIVGMVMFYSLISVVSIILGDILMSIVDPRISFTNKAR